MTDKPRPTTIVNLSDWVAPALMSEEEMWALSPALYGEDEAAAAEAAAKLELQAKMLLLGYVDKSGAHRYFASGGEKEDLARKALAHLLSADRMSRSLLDDLARVIDPMPRMARTVKFGFRGAGSPDPQRLKHLRIGREMSAAVKAGATVGSAIAAACEKHGLSERFVRKIWARFCKEK
jgi:hypothetical protein